MSVKRTAVRILISTLALSLMTVVRADVPWGTDVPDGKDHPLMQRFTGAWMVGYSQKTFDQAVWPRSAAVVDSSTLKDAQVIEGQITRLVYVTPKGKGPLEVFRNHQQAFVAAGFKPQLNCEMDCDKFYWAWWRHAKPVEGVRWQTQGSIPAGEGGGRYGVNSAVTAYHGRFWAGSRERNGQDVKVLLYVGDAENDKTGISAVYLQIIEPRPMASGQVKVMDAVALGSSIASEGKAILGGLTFDTGKATLRPESRAQLEAMAQILKTQPGWKVYIVGHTDNVGNFEANQALSSARAQSVVAALSSQPYGIDAKRLVAKGVANVSPVASNAEEAGRSLNRRVEMVLQ